MTTSREVLGRITLSRVLLLLGSLLFVVPDAPIHAGEPTGSLAGFARSRSWADQSGQFKIEGTLKHADDQKVELLKKDGRVVTVPFDKLSRPDQTFVRAFLQAEAALGSDDGADAEVDNPFAGGVPLQPAANRNTANTPAARPAATRGGASRPSARNIPRSGRATDRGSGPSATGDTVESEEIRMVNAVVRGARPLTITPSRDFWSAKPPRALPDIRLEDAILPVDLAKPFFASMRVAAAGRSATVVLNAYQQGRGGRSENYGRFAIVDAGSDTVSPVYEFDQPWKLMALSPDASLVAALRVEGFDKGNDMAIFRIVQGELVPLFQFTAGGGSWDEIHWAAFLPGFRLITISQKNDLTIWDLANKIAPKALYRGSTGGATTGVITPAGELIAFSVGSQIAVVETESGRLAGCITREIKADQIAFAPHGRYLAAFHPFTVTLYSLEDGQEVKTFAVSESNAQAPFRWSGEHLLVGSVLYDVERSLPLWSYEGRPAAQTSHGSYLISAFGGDSGSTVTLLKVPHEEALRAATDVDPQSIYALVPGDSVSVEYDLSPAASSAHQPIRQAVESKLQQLGWKLAANAPNKIKIELIQGDQEQIDYYTRTGFGPFLPPPGFGGPPSGPAERIQFRPWTHRLTISVNNQPIFNNQYVRSAPQSLQTKEGETTAAAVAKFVQPVPEHFQNMAIPPHLLKPEFQGGMGKSTLSDSGLR